jgi:hypothetical protein
MIFGRSLPPSKLRRLRFQQSVDVCISRSTTASRPRQRACGSASCRLGGASCTNASMRYVNLSGYHQAHREHRLTRPFEERKLAKACSVSLTASMTLGSEPSPRSQTIQNISSGSAARLSGGHPETLAQPTPLSPDWQRLSRFERSRERCARIAVLISASPAVSLRWAPGPRIPAIPRRIRWPLTRPAAAGPLSARGGRVSGFRVEGSRLRSVPLRRRRPTR